MKFEALKEVILSQCGGVEHSKFEEIQALLDSIPELLKTEAALNALGAAGVDNWEGYDIAMDMM